MTPAHRDRRTDEQGRPQAMRASTATGSDGRDPSRSRSPIDPGARNGGTNTDSARMRMPRDAPTERSEPPD